MNTVDLIVNSIHNNGPSAIQAQVDVITESTRSDLMQRLNIVASLRDLDEPILYQLLENPSNKSAEKGTISRKMQDTYHQSESKISSLIPKVTLDSGLSPFSILKSDDAYAERGFKQYDDAPRKTERRNSYESQSIGPRGSSGYDSADDLAADEKKSSEYTKESSKDHKNNSDVRKFDLMAKHSADSDESRDKYLFKDDILPVVEKDDVEEYAIEVGADSESTASFSLEYGYVEDSKSVVIKKEVVDIEKEATSTSSGHAFSDDDKSTRSPKSNAVQSVESKKGPGISSIQENSSVGVKKFDQVRICFLHFFLFFFRFLCHEDTIQYNTIQYNTIQYNTIICAFISSLISSFLRFFTFLQMDKSINLFIFMCSY